MVGEGRSVGVSDAIELLNNSEIVALPTETVYGLAADATQSEAIAKVYLKKKRPKINPLICHVADISSAEKIGRLNNAAKQLAEAFWPGPLTLVVPQTDDCAVDPLATAGLDSIAIRVPDHALMQAVLVALPNGLVAPSANLSGKLSPVLPEHVWQSLGPDTPVLEGGRCQAGLESTIISCTDEASPHLLREGAIAKTAIEKIVGPLDSPQSKITSQPTSPGQMLAHYSPDASLRLNADNVAEGEIGLGFGAHFQSHWNLSPSGNLEEAATNLFFMLHALDKAGAERIAVAPIPEIDLGRAINDRLRRAAYK